MHNNRIAFIDYLRIAACFLVMLVHSSESFYCYSADGSISMLATEANRFWVSFYDGFLGRISVPLFMIVSAFLLVPMREGQTMTQFYRRRFSRILPPFILFLLIYCLLPLAWGGMTWEQSVADLKMLPFNFPSMAGHLWFMYPLISLYLIIPVISPWLARSTAREERIFIGLFAFSTFLPILHKVVGPELWGECFWNHFSMLWYCSGYIGYLVLAHYIRVHLDWSRRKKLTVGSLCFLIGASVAAFSFWYQGVPGLEISTPQLEILWAFCTPDVLLATFGMFLLFTCIRQTEAPRFVSRLSGLTFGMYLMHMLFLAPISAALIAGNVAQPLLPVGLTIPLTAIATFICASCTTLLLSYIPGSRWIVGTER